MRARRSFSRRLTGSVAVWIATCALALCAGCARTPELGDQAETNVTQGPSNAQNRTIDGALAMHTSMLMAIPGVVGVAQGATAEGRPAILVMLAKEDASARARIPGTLEGFPVIIEVTGEIRAMPDFGR